MRVLVSGSTGLLGSALARALTLRGHQVTRLVRAPAAPGKAAPTDEQDVVWNAASGSLGANAEGADAVVHLAGASIAGGRWTAARKRLLGESRVAATHGLIDGLSKLARPPKIFVGASAIGFYGDRGGEELTESSAAGTDFLADLARQWEAESLRAASFGARAAVLRFGVVLAKHGGALPQMALPFRLGVGGRVGSGRQWMSWIALEDAVAIIVYALTTQALAGPANAVAPQPVRNADFAKVLARVLHRPALFPAPAFALRLALGEVADALLLSSQRVLPRRLQQLGYRFAQPDLEAALRSVLAAQ
jgi:uncharacterized protein (TIGR01777 family)